VTAALLAVAVEAQAQDPVIWGNNAQSPVPATIEQFDQSTGLLNLTHRGVNGNGRGIVVVGDIVYYTMVSDPVIHMMSASTGADLGGITTTVSSMSTIAWDGSGFWTSDYSGTNRAFKIALDGTLEKTINLSLASNYMDGMEWFENKLIANRCDACGGLYDIYDLDGNVLTAGFIDTGHSSTGIAYDGTNFFVSYIYENTIGVFDDTGTWVRDMVLAGGVNSTEGYSSRYLEDLSVDYAGRSDVVPEPTSVLLIATGLLGIAWVRRRKERMGTV
jgi:hypothetical protein